MKIQSAILWTAAFCLSSSAAIAQSRDTGWEFGADVVFQTSQDIGFDNGTTTFEDDIGLSLYAGYRMSSRLEFQFGLDWSNADYKAEYQPPQLPNTTINIDSEIEEFTPFAKVNFNFLEGPITPFVSANVGWSFIDTNIPEGQAQVGCWWDPWYGQICTTYQPTRSTDHSRMARESASVGTFRRDTPCVSLTKSSGMTWTMPARRTSTGSSSELCSCTDERGGQGMP